MRGFKCEAKRMKQDKSDRDKLRFKLEYKCDKCREENMYPDNYSYCLIRCAIHKRLKALEERNENSLLIP